MRTLRITPFLFFALISSASASPRLPESWYLLPETIPPSVMKKEPCTDCSETNLETWVKQIYETNSDAMHEALSGSSSDNNTWHLDAFTTDLAITAQGLLGVLTVKGTPAVVVAWRKQKSDYETNSDPQHEPGMISLDAGAGLSELEPTVKAILATGKVKDPLTLRKNLRQTWSDFKNLLTVFDSDARQRLWSVSSFRFDFSVDGSGRFHPIAAAGGDLRLRFEWKRIRNSQAPASIAPPNVSSGSGLSDSLIGFAHSLEDYLESTPSDALDELGFAPYQFRIGIGFIGQGRIGIAKGSAAVLGHLYFLRNQGQPRRNSISVANTLEPLWLVEDQPTPENLNFARANQIYYERSSRRAIYRLVPEKLLKGLSKSVKIGAFFAKSGARLRGNTWKMQEVRTAFDISISGDVGLISLTGLASAELYFRRK